MVSLITVNYNNSMLTAQLLESIQQLRINDLEVIVVDNGSKENPAPTLCKMFPWVTFIRSEVNLGFAGGNNLGIRAAQGKYLFFVNNDTEFWTDIIPRMVSILRRNPGVGIICPVIHYYDDPSSVQYAGYTEMSKLTGRNQCLTSLDASSVDGLIKTSYAHGAAMMVPMEVIRKVGLMPENYFLYYEELDWCESIRKAGYEIVVDTLSDFYHKESKTVGAISELKSYFMSRNRILFMRRNANVFSRMLFWIYFIAIATPLQVLRYTMHKQWRNIEAHLAGIQWNFSFGKSSEVIGYKFNYLNNHE